MRQLKFRIWDKNGESFLGNPPKIFDWNYIPQMLYPENFVVQQFTGLLDSEGKEIYEGDILEVKGWRGSKGIAEVKWEQQDSSDDAGVNMVGFRRFDEYGEPKIIGNTMQNPELLKNANN